MEIETDSQVCFPFDFLFSDLVSACCSYAFNVIAYCVNRALGRLIGVQIRDKIITETAFYFSIVIKCFILRTYRNDL